MADLPSILGGMAQGFLDFGKSAVDLFGTGGASIADLIESARTGKVTTRNSDDFRKWLYDTNDVKDAAAKGLGTALNGVQTVSDYIPGIGAVTRNPLFNAGQGALGGLADEFKMYGKDYDLGRAGQRAAVGAGGALASTGLADALKGSGNALLKSGTAQGLARGAVGGAIGAGGYTAIDGGSLGDVANSALQGAGMGAALGGTMGALQDFKPARNYDMALTDEEKAARIANAKNMLANEQDPERIAELNNQIKDLGGTIGNAPSENMKLYRGISAPDDATLQRYIDEMKDPNIAPTTYSGGSAYGQGYYFTPDEGLARYYASESGLPSTAIMEIEVPRNRFTEISKENGNRPADFDLAAIKRGVPEDIRYETGLKDFNDYLDNNGYWGSKTGGENPTYTIMRNDAVLNAKRIDAPSLETALAADDMAVNSPRYLTDENGNPRTLYHGSPNANITEFDINQAGKNTMSGEHALFFTDDLGTADNFAHEQIPTESMFFVEKGKRGKVYPVNLEMNNPLDLDNLTDAQIEELWPYASQMGSWQGKDHFVKQLTDWRDKYHNAQQTKGYLDLDKLRDSQYDGIIARMYPNQDNQAREYAVFDNSKIKMLEDVLANDNMTVNSAPEIAAVIAGKNRNWDELYGMLSKDAGAFENEDRTPITASPSQLRSEIQAIDAKYPNDMPDDIWDKRYGLNQQLKAAEKGYNSPYDYYVGESKKNFRQDFESRPDKYKSKIADIESRAQRQAALDQDIANASPRKLAQFNLIQQKNPAPNETLTWIRSPKDILTWDEAIAGAEGDNAFTWPDYTLEDALRDQKKHSMTVYSSYPIKGGTFVTPSRQQASDYAGGGRVYSKVIRPDDVAWINGDEGQYAYTRKK